MQIIGVAAGLFGAAGLILINADGAITFDQSFGFLIVFACLLYGLSVNTVKAYLTGINSLVISGFALLFVGLPYGIYLFTTDFIYILTHTEGAWKGAVYVLVLAMFGTALSNILYFQLVKIASPLFASAVTYLIPVVALLWGLADGERLHMLHIPALLLILGGVGLISYQGYRNRKRQAE
jgi:drug/metabolite transporter (DMT)-like permease